MSRYEQPLNTATVFVENGVFSREGVEKLMARRLPILKVKMNVDGKELEIALRFKMIYDEAIGQYTNQFYTTSTGNKMLKGKVELPYVANAVDSVTEKSQATQQVEDEFGDDVPF